MCQPVLETQRLLLRALQPDDACQIHFLANNPQISDMTAQIPYPYPRELATSWISSQKDNWINRKGMVYGITLKNNSLLTGVISLQKIDSAFPVLGYWLGIDFWGNGYSTEAAGCICDFSFNHLSVKKIFACHLQKNPASGSVLKKLGFNFHGIEEKTMMGKMHGETLLNYILTPDLLIKTPYKVIR